MTELRKGQRAQIEVVVEDGKPDSDGEVSVKLPPGCSSRTAYVTLSALRFGETSPTYLARREAMVRARCASKDPSAQFDPGGLVQEADDALRAIDETPVPDWAGGEHE